MRLIDADRFKAVNGMKDDCADCDKELRGKSKACEFDRIYTKMDFCGWLDDAPTADAVPVVLCKDCARFDKKRGCNLVDGLNIAKTDSFCSYGERKDG